jgi:hypothetical protein
MIIAETLAAAALIAGTPLGLDVSDQIKPAVNVETATPIMYAVLPKVLKIAGCEIYWEEQ